MEFIGQAVPHGDAREFGQLLHGGLGEAAVFDTVEHASEHAGGVFHGFLDADLRAGRTQVRDMGTLVVGCHFKGAAGAGGGLLENQGDVLALHPRLFGAGVFGALQVTGQIKEILYFLGGKVEQLEEAAVSEVVSHC